MYRDGFTPVVLLITFTCYNLPRALPLVDKPVYQDDSKPGLFIFIFRHLYSANSLDTTHEKFESKSNFDYIIDFQFSIAYHMPSYFDGHDYDLGLMPNAGSTA